MAARKKAPTRTKKAAKKPQGKAARKAIPRPSGRRNGTARSGSTSPMDAAAITGSVTPRAPSAGGSAVRGITPFLWFDDNMEEAARFYVSLFPDSRIEGLSPMGGSFVLAGQRFMGLNGGPHYQFTPAVSFFVVCRDQAEVDRLWDALEDGGKPSRCGWIDDRFGVTWQIVPEAFLRLTADKDPRKVKAVFDAMMGMVKMDVAGLQLAYETA